MNYDFWHDKWRRNEIGFHEDSVNAYLQNHWNALEPRGTETVFVPLCGKSKDIFWINDKGHPILGVELSPIACKDLFEEANLKTQVSTVGEFTHYKHNEIDIYCGDFFALQPENTRHVRYVYDRAALIALPEPMRQTYVDKLNQLLKPDTECLLVSMEYNQNEMTGPPFAVTKSMIETYYSSHWEIHQIHEAVAAKDDPFAKRKGLSELKEVVYKLVKQK